MDKNDDEIPTTPKNGSSSQVLRRSSRKRSMPAASTFRTSPSAKKSRKLTPVPCSPVVPTLTTLPSVVTTKLLLYLDVDTLENLSSSCSYFHQLIAGRFLTSINFPFTVDFISEMRNAACIEKKPLLKLKCKKSKDQFIIFSDYFIESNISFHKIISSKGCDMKDYLALSQMSLLSLDKLREVDLVPDSLGRMDIWRLYNRRIGYYSDFDARLLMQITRFGSLHNVTRLNVLVDENFYLEQFMTQMPNLIELGLNILTSAKVRKRNFLTEYLPRLEAVVAATKAPVLKLTMLLELKHPVKKILKNCFIEKLIVTGPCNFNIFPVMERLREVMVKVDTNALNNNDECIYWKSQADDRVLHRAGLCCVNMRAVYKNCPSLERFMGVDVGNVDQKQTFREWNSVMKEKFYRYYQNQGGSKEFEAWVKTRWFSKKFVVP